VTSSSWGGRRYLPYVFTEQGVAMLSSVLHSPRAVQVNIEIMRAFVRLRQMLQQNADLARKLALLERPIPHRLRRHPRADETTGESKAANWVWEAGVSSRHRVASQPALVRPSRDISRDRVSRGLAGAPCRRSSTTLATRCMPTTWPKPPSSTLPACTADPPSRRRDPSPSFCTHPGFRPPGSSYRCESVP